MKGSGFTVIREILGDMTDGGVSGDEKSLESIKNLLGRYAEVKTDNMNNIIGTVGEGKKHIMLDAHIDRIGLIVTAVEDSGFLRFGKVGGCDARTLSAAEVTVYGKKKIYGVITSTPPHLSKAEDAEKAPEFDGMYIDTGLTGEDAKRYISPGDRVTIDAPAAFLGESRVTGAALDNRLGAAVLLRVLDILKDKSIGVLLSVLLSAQEETTEAGGRTGAFLLCPDEAIAVDVSFALSPGVDETEGAKLGGGGMICVSPSLSYEMSDELMKTAASEGIPYQTEVCPSATGTNADVIASSRAGVKTGLISVPIRNMHTQAELADINDAENTARLIAAYILKKGAECNA